MSAVNPLEPLRNFNFIVEIGGISSSIFSEVIMPESICQVIEYREGGDVVLSSRKLPGRIEYENIILMRGYTQNSELYDWWKTVVEGHTERRNMSIVILNIGRQEILRWNFLNAFPVRYQSSNLQASGDEVLMEIVEIAFDRADLEFGK